MSRDLREAALILAVVIVILVALWMLSGASHVGGSR